MINTCICCGDIIPDGTQICPICFNGGLLCPDCRSVLETMNTSTCIVDDKFMLCTLYHCNCCHSDWERKANYIGEPVKFTRKFWG